MIKTLLPILLFLLVISELRAQSKTYTDGGLVVEVFASNPCEGASNGYINFTVVSTSDNLPAQLQVIIGPPNLFVTQTIGVGSSFKFNAPETLPVNNYDFIIVDNSGTDIINTFALNDPVVFTNLPDITVTDDPSTDLTNSNCSNPDGQIALTIAGGSKVLAGGGQFTYEFETTNGLPGFPIVGTTDGNSVLDLATLAGLPGLPGGNYTLELHDDYSNCFELKNWSITDPQPALYAITNGPTQAVCQGSDATIQLNGSEAGVGYEVLVNGIYSGVSAVGTGAPLTITLPSGLFNNGQTLVIRAILGSCIPRIMTGSITMTVNPLPTISGVVVGSVCVGSISTNLNYTGTTGSPSQYSIDFDATAEAQGFVDVVSAALPASPITITLPALAAAGNYNATLTVTNTTTGCPSTGIPITVTLIANPTITLGTNPSVCIGSPTASLPYSATTGSPNQYSINFNAGAEAQGFVDVVNGALPPSPIAITVPGIAVAGTYNATLTVRSTSSTCSSSSQPITVTINSNPTITLGANPTVCSGSTAANLGYSATTGSPDQYSINFNAAAEAQGFTDVVNAALPATPIVITVPGAATAGTYNATLSVRNNATGCVSANSNITVTVVSSPTITLGANPAVCIGAATANLPYTATSGGPNQYSIDFDAAAQGQGFVDVVNVVLPASPIVITVPGAAGAGTYNGTLTVLNTVTGCASTSQPITVTINPTPGITLGPNPSVCTGATSANLGYSAITGSPNQYSIDFNAAAQAQGFLDVVNAALPATPIVITVPGAGAAGTYNATLTVRNSATGCVSGSQPISVTILASPTITLGPNPSVCTGSSVANLTYSATTATPNQYSINFNAAAEAQGFVDVVNAALPASPIVVTVPAAVAAGTYSATLSVRNSGTGCTSANSNISITVIANPTITLGANPSVCIGSASANLGYSATTGSPNQYSIDFNAAAQAQGFIDVVTAALPASPIVITVPGAAVAGTYNGTLTVLNTVTGCVSSSQPISVTINSTPGITLGASPSVCTGATSANLGYSATTGTPNQYSIDFNAAAQAQGFVDVVNAALPATPIVITVPGAAAAGAYNANLTVRNSTTGCISSTQPITINIVPSPTITIGPNPSVCVGTTTANLTYSATTASPNQYSLNFNGTAEAQGFVDVLNAALPATPIMITVPAAAAAGTYTATLSVLNTVTGCSSGTQNVSVTITANPTISLGANPSVCIGAITANLGYTATTGSPNQYSIDFDAAAQAQGFTDVVNAALPASPIVVTIPGAAVAGTYNGTLTVLNSVTGCASISQPVTVTINNTPTITLGANPSVCEGDVAASLPYSATTASPNQYSINFDAAAEAEGFVDVVNAALGATPISIPVPGGAGAGVYNATITVRNSSSSCQSVAQPITVTINALPSISGIVVGSVCAGSTSTNLNYTTTTGAPNQYSIDFDATAEAQGFVDVVNSVLPASPVTIVIPALAGAGNYNALVTVNNSSAACPSSSVPITITILANPTITLGPNPSVCAGTTTASLVYTATTGSPNQYSINFDAAAEAQGFADVTAVALPASPISIAVPAAAAPGTFNAAITVLSTSSTCASTSQPISVTINANPTITLGPDPSICSGLASVDLSYSAITGSPDQFSINFDAAAEAQGFADVMASSLPASPMAITVPVGAIAGIYNGTLSAINSTTGCASTGQPFSITVLQSPTAAISGSATICSGSSTNLTVNFTGTGPWSFQYSDGTTTSASIPSFFNSITFPVNPTTTTTYTLVAVSDNTVCTGSVSGTAIVTVNQAPATNLPVDVAIDPLCSGGSTDVTVTNSQVGVSYQLRNDADNSLVGTAVTGTGGIISLSTGSLVSTQTFNVLATATGCAPVELATLATVNVTGTINPSLAVTALANPICEGTATVIQVANSENGVLYQLRDDSNNNLVGSAVAGNGATIDLPTGSLTTTTTFNVLASNGSCSIELTDLETVNVNVDPDPSLAVAADLSTVCEGGSTIITVTLSQVGVSYQLRTEPGNANVGTAVAGTGGTINLATGPLLTTMTFNVLAVSGVCPAIELTAQATVTVTGVIDPTLAVTVQDNPICEGAGTNIQVANSTNGVSYQLRNDADDSPVGPPVVGNGLTIDFPTGNLAVTTTFNILANNGVCTIELDNVATVVVDAQPDASLVVGITLNPLCTSGTSAITVAASQLGVSYQLRNDSDNSNIGAAVAGTGGAISLPTGVLNATTTFNVLASSGVCSSVELTQLATVNVTGSLDASLDVTTSAGTICGGASTFIQVVLSENGVSYQLRNDADDTNIGAAVVGNGGTINLPTGNLSVTTVFNVVANNGSCSIELTDTQSVTVNPAPDITLAVSPSSGLICSGTSTSIIVTASELGVSYQLRNSAGNVNVGSAITGTGNNISLPTGNLTTSTTFNVLATLGTCSTQLTATASVAIRPSGDPACGPGGSDCANFSAIIPTIVTQPSCNDRDAGEISFNISRSDGSATTFRVIWSYNGTDQTKFTSNVVSFDDLNSGLYQYTVIDEGNGMSCGPVDFFLDLKTQVEIQDKEVIANVTCYEGTDGNVKLTVDGTTTGEYWYKYVLDGQESVAQTFTPGAPLPGGLPADDDDFIIIKVDESSAFACPDTVMVRINHIYPKIDFSVTATGVSTCNGTDGAIQVAAITGGNTTTSPQQIRLKKEVPLSTDPSGYIVVSDFEAVASGSKEYTDLAQGNYVVDVMDESSCIQSKPIAIQAPGQIPLAFVDISVTDAGCANEGASGSIQVTINEPGIYELAVSQDQVNVPPDDQFVSYNSPSLPNVVFNNLIRGRYFLYIKSSTTDCPTRTDVIAVGGVYAVGDFEVLSNCENVNLTLNNISGQEDTPFVIRVFNNNDKFFKIDSLTSPSIPLSNSVSFIYSAPLQHKFLTEEGTYRFVMIQTQTTGVGACTLVSDTVVYEINQQVDIVLGAVKPSFPDPKRTGSIEIENILGGSRFVSSSNELYYEISLATADDDVVVFDWAPAKLNPQNKFAVLFDYLSPAVYRVKVRDASGCIKTLDVEISLDPSVYVPNIFTPNDDAVNDAFEVLNLPLDGKHKLIISNRWGNEVYTSNDYREGTFWKAEGASDGIYFYRLQVQGGDTYSGWVEVLRGDRP